MERSSTRSTLVRALIDTSDAYGREGSKERLVGGAIAGRRDRVQVATKWGIVPGPSETARAVAHYHQQQASGWTRGPRGLAAIEGSLRGLGVDAIDLWYLHFPDPGVSIEESVGAMAELVAEGKARHLGVCNVTAEQAISAHRVHPIAAVQGEYSLWTRYPEREPLPTLRELGIGFVSWSPLGAGFFAGAAERIGAPGEDFRTNRPRFNRSNLTANRDRHVPLRSLAAGVALTPAQLALAWLLRQGPDIVAIPGTRSPHSPGREPRRRRPLAPRR